MIMLPKISKNGFTLIELLVVATIIIVLTTIGLVSYRTVSRNSRNAKRKTDIETVRQAAIMYRSEIGDYPEVEGDNEARFVDLVGDLYGAGYLTESAFTDPINADPYEYRYRIRVGGDLVIDAHLEPNAAQYLLELP